jgi:hypothetical protein
MWMSARWRARLTEPRDAASLRAFRLLFGAVMACGMVRLLAKGWVTELYVRPAYHFPYADGALSWVRPWPGMGMYVHVATLAALAVGIAAGVRARLCAALFFVGFVHLELIDRALYLNHYYLATVLVGMLALLAPAARRATVPAWVLYAFRAQVGLVYFYAGVAKLNADWLLRAQPLRAWLAASADLPLVGAWLETPAAAFAASWTGAAFDLAIVPGLLWRRTRPAALAALLGFHAATAALFNIGLFPFIMAAGATLFLAPEWPRRFGWPARAGETPAQRPSSWVVPAVVAAHLAVQLVLPLRQHLTAEPSAWTGKGFDFAWNVMVAERSGAVTFRAVERGTGREVVVRPSAALTPLQGAAMAQDPALIATYARHLASELGREGWRDVGVFADAQLALNGRAGRRLLDPGVDLARRPPSVEPLGE